MEKLFKYQVENLAPEKPNRIETHVTIWELEDDHEELTAREREIIQLIWQNVDSKEIAEELGVALTTVESHQRNINNKLKSSSVIETLRKALDLGYINTLKPYND